MDNRYTPAEVFNQGFTVNPAVPVAFGFAVTAAGHVVDFIDRHTRPKVEERARKRARVDKTDGMSGNIDWGQSTTMPYANYRRIARRSYGARYGRRRTYGRRNYRSRYRRRRPTYRRRY